MRRPNILILYTDQQRWDALGANGNPEIRTPNLDRLASQGLNYSHHFVQNPVCMPSRISFLTGQYPSQLGITHMAVTVPPETPTLPRLLGPWGYHTANIGKLHFLPHSNRDHREPHPDYGFDHLEISDEPGCYEDAYRAWVRRKAPDQVDRISVGLPPVTPIWQRMVGFRDGITHPERGEDRTEAFAARSDLTHTSFVAEQTMEYLRARRAGEPFLCISGFYSPHSPWVVPQEYLDLYDPARLSVPRYPAEWESRRGERFSDAALRRAKQGYYAMITEVDHHVGRILGCLEEQGLAEETIVLFTSDHGEYLGDLLRFSKGFPGEECISRVPLLVRWPAGLGRSGRTIPHLVEAVDVLPTLLDWAGIPIPPRVQGVPLPAHPEPGAGTKRSALLESEAGKTLRTERYRYVARMNGREEMYDLERDLGEYHDVAADPEYVGALSECRGEMVRRLLQMERPLKREWPY